MKLAVRGRLLLLEAPIPPQFWATSVVSFEEVVNVVTWEPSPDDPTKRVRRETYEGQEVALQMYVKLADGRVAFPRWAFSDAQLEAFSYQVVDLSDPPVELHPELVAARRPALREYQLAPFAYATQYNRGVLRLGTGRGKTVVALAIIRFYKQAALIFVDTIDLMHQWVERITEHLGIPEDRIGKLSGNSSEWVWDGYPIVIATVQSWFTQLDNCEVPQELLSDVGVVVWDELHAFKGEVVGASTLGMFNAKRFGLTATPHTDGQQEIYLRHIGPIVYQDLTTDMVPEVHFHRIEVPEGKGGGGSYLRMASALLGSPSRKPSPEYLEGLKTVLQGLQDRGRTVLAITPRTRAGHALAVALDDAAMIDTTVKGDQRRAMLNRHRTVIVINVLGEKALDRKDIDTVVYLIPPGKSAVDRIRQGAGRGLRGLEGKESAELHFCSPGTPYGVALARAAAANCSDLGYTMVNPPRTPPKGPSGPSESMQKVSRFLKKPSHRRKA